MKAQSLVIDRLFLCKAGRGVSTPLCPLRLPSTVPGDSRSSRTIAATHFPGCPPLQGSMEQRTAWREDVFTRPASHAASPAAPPPAPPQQLLRAQLPSRVEGCRVPGVSNALADARSKGSPLVSSRARVARRRRPGGGRDRNATGEADSGDPRCENSGFWKSGRPLSRFVHHYSPRPHVVSC